MFLLLLIAVLMGCQQFSGHRPIGNAVLCPLWRKAWGTKKLRVEPFQSLWISGEGGMGWVIACDQIWWWCLMAWLKFEMAVMESLGEKWRIWDVLRENSYQLFCGYTAFFGHMLSSSRTVRPRVLRSMKLFIPGLLSSPSWDVHLSLSCLRIEELNCFICLEISRVRSMLWGTDDCLKTKLKEMYRHKFVVREKGGAPLSAEFRYYWRIIADKMSNNRIENHSAHNGNLSWKNNYFLTLGGFILKTKTTKNIWSYMKYKWLLYMVREIHVLD